MVVSYRGGPECWWEVRTRGRVYRIPGTAAVHDALADIWEGKGGRIE